MGDLRLPNTKTGCIGTIIANLTFVILMLLGYPLLATILVVIIIIIMAIIDSK